MSDRRHFIPQCQHIDKDCRKMRFRGPLKLTAYCVVSNNFSHFEMASLSGTVGRQYHSPRTVRDNMVWMRPLFLRQECPCSLLGGDDVDVVVAPSTSPPPGRLRPRRGNPSEQCDEFIIYLGLVTIECIVYTRQEEAGERPETIFIYV
jgi:hypothetical protein